mmetsp:Transcript_57692/g.132446  ORF Transcript_57692/g.132446 Transcript_57692/m.132446 type:complete len:201 (+) Transcript_57692:199-801(+)
MAACWLLRAASTSSARRCTSSSHSSISPEKCMTSSASRSSIASSSSRVTPAEHCLAVCSASFSFTKDSRLVSWSAHALTKSQSTARSFCRPASSAFRSLSTAKSSARTAAAMPRRQLPALAKRERGRSVAGGASSSSSQPDAVKCAYMRSKSAAARSSRAAMVLSRRSQSPVLKWRESSSRMPTCSRVKRISRRRSRRRE